MDQDGGQTDQIAEDSLVPVNPALVGMVLGRVEMSKVITQEVEVVDLLVGDARYTEVSRRRLLLLFFLKRRESSCFSITTTKSKAYDGRALSYGGTAISFGY